VRPRQGLGVLEKRNVPRSWTVSKGSRVLSVRITAVLTDSTGYKTVLSLKYK
jgi:hypothetical protein